MSSVKKACICALCAALCSVLPILFHMVGLGAAFSPLHLPVLLCGVVCGPAYGAFCGVAGPVISGLLTSMPTGAQLIYMVPELCVYGLTAGLLMKAVRTGRETVDVWLSLIGAMVLGRVVGGAAQALFYLSSARSYSMALWAGGYLVGTLPGAVSQLVVIPVLVRTLSLARLIPGRYPTKEAAV